MNLDRNILIIKSVSDVGFDKHFNDMKGIDLGLFSVKVSNIKGEKLLLSEIFKRIVIGIV